MHLLSSQEECFGPSALSFAPLLTSSLKTDKRPGVGSWCPTPRHEEEG